MSAESFCSSPRRSSAVLAAATGARTAVARIAAARARRRGTRTIRGRSRLTGARLAPESAESAGWRAGDPLR